MGREGREFVRRSWQNHPKLAPLLVAVGMGIVVLGLIELAEGDTGWRGVLLGLLWIVAIVLVMLLIRRDQPPAAPESARDEGTSI